MEIMPSEIFIMEDCNEEDSNLSSDQYFCPECKGKNIEYDSLFGKKNGITFQKLYVKAFCTQCKTELIAEWSVKEMKYKIKIK